MEAVPPTYGEIRKVMGCYFGLYIPSNGCGSNLFRNFENDKNAKTA